MVDTDGRLLVAQVGPASVQDRDGAVPLLERVNAATRIAIEIVRKIRGRVGFRGAPASMGG